MDSRQAIIERAIQLAEMGYKIFPLNGKIPAFRSWPQIATSDIEKIKVWFQHPAPFRNIGLLTGSKSNNIVAVDTDVRNYGDDTWGTDNTPRLAESCGAIEQSGRQDGGMHYFFRAPDKFLKSRVLAKGVDYIANKKYIVMAPSIHPDTGHPFTLDKGDILNPFCLNELPDFVQAILEQHLTLEDIHAKAPIEIKDTLELGERTNLLMRLDRLNPDKGRHYQIGGWVIDAVAAGMPEPEIISFSEAWIREKGGREPQYNEMQNLAKSARAGLTDGSLYVSERIDPEGIAERFEKKTPEEMEASKEHSNDWRNQLRVSGSGTIQKTSYNARMILENDSKIREKLKKNEMQETLVKLEPMPWDNPSLKFPKYGRQWLDEDTASLKHYISADYDCEMSKANIEDALMSFGQAHYFHPIKDWLLETEWDGEKRLDNWLVTVAGCEDNEYNRTVGKMLLIGLCARILRPGVKFDEVIIFEGPQGTGKSTLCKELVSEEFFCETPGDISSKETIENSLGNWLIEIPEIESYIYRYRSSDLKRFLSTSTDTIRLPYGRRSQKILRQFLMVGTTNKTEYLVDQTGNRRYLPVQCGSDFFNFPYLKSNREQLFAEALQRYKNGESFYQDNAFTIHSMKEQRKRMLTDPWASKISEYMLVKGEATVTDIWEHAFLMPSSGLDLKKSGRIKRGLIQLGYSEDKGSKKWRMTKKGE